MRSGTRGCCSTSTAPCSTRTTCTCRISRAELEEAGAAAVYDDPAALLDALDDSPIGTATDSRLVGTDSDGLLHFAWVVPGARVALALALASARGRRAPPRTRARAPDSEDLVLVARDSAWQRGTPGM